MISKKRFHLLPMVIAVCCLVLIVRLQNIADVLSDPTPFVNTAQAEEKQAEPAQTPPPENQPSVEPVAEQTETPDNDPPLMTNAELKVLYDLAERRKALDNWEKELQAKSDELKVAEKRLDTKITELQGIEQKITAYADQYKQKSNDHLASLIKIYENMKPKDASRIFEEMDLNILLDVVEQMSERKVAPILSGMDPQKARILIEELALRKRGMTFLRQQ